MNTEAIEKVVNRVFFVLGFLLLTLAIAERVVNAAGYTVLRASYTPGRLLELAAIMLLVVAVLLLRQISHALRERSR